MKMSVNLSLIALLFLSLLLVSPTQVSYAQTGTQVTGILSTNTTWTKANSPYTLTGAIGVPVGVTLTIEAGVTVNLVNYYIQVNGTLVARGNADYPIQLNNGQIKFTPSCNSWNEQTGLGCIIENTNLNSTYVAIDSSSLKINANNFTNNGQSSGDCLVISGGSSLISNNTFIIRNQGSGYCIAIRESNASILSNKIVGGYSGVKISGPYLLPDYRTISPIIENNLIIGSVMGIRIEYNNAKPIIRNNTITENSIGIFFTMANAVEPVIVFNNIFNNSYDHSTKNVDLSGDGSGLRSNINATYNWWGTTNREEINQTIIDYKNDFNLGVVEFDPFLVQANIQAPVVPTFTIQASSSQGGSISPNGILKLSYGIQAEFTITPDDGYKLGTVLVDNVSITFIPNPFPIGDPNKAYYTFPNILANHTIQASFVSLASPTANPTQSPTSNPTTNPTQRPTTNPTTPPTIAPTPSPTVPEVPSISVLLLLIPLTLALIMYAKRRNPQFLSFS
jgi:hypothetical protein